MDILMRTSELSKTVAISYERSPQWKHTFIFHNILAKRPDSGQELSVDIPTNISIPEDADADDQSNGDHNHNEYMQTDENIEQTGIHHDETNHHVIQQHEMLDTVTGTEENDDTY